MLPLLWWNNTITCKIHCNSPTIIICYFWTMFPLFRGNYSIICKIHSNSPFTLTCNVWIMIIFLIWNLLLIISLIHCLSSIKFIFISFWILILFILPFFWNYNSIIPKIIANCISFIISQLRIKLILFIWYNTLYSLFKSMNLILCQFLLTLWHLKME